jgi:serine/threonine protein kinase
MGVVQMVADTKLSRAIALKFRSDDLSDDRQALERLQREAQAASALNHPNTCTLTKPRELPAISASAAEPKSEAEPGYAINGLPYT